MSNKKVLNKRSNQTVSGGAPKAPVANGIDYGEIAINYHEGVEKIFVKNDGDSIVAFSSDEQIKADIRENFLSTTTAQTLSAYQKQQALTNLGIADELVRINLVCADASAISGATVTITCNGNPTPQTWEGSTLTFVVPMFEEYTVSFETVPGFYTPDSVTKIAKKNMVRTITAYYIDAPYSDLSMLDYTGGTVSVRETANCYIISEAGYYELPLVYGCGIVSGETNTASYTQVAGTYTKPFYNYLNNQITSPFIEDDTGIQAVSAEVVLIDSQGYTIDGVYLTDRSLCKFLRFHVSAIPALGGNATIAIKDGSGQIMWSWHIWAYPFTLSTFAHTNTNNKTYNILDVNLGWVKAAADSKKGTSPYYQWGRKDPMLRSGGSAVVGTYGTTTTAGSVAAAIQNPTTFNTYETTHYNWWQDNDTAVDFYNYWDASQTSTGNGDRTIVKTIYDPSPVGFHIPCGNTFLGFSASNGGTWDNGYEWDGNYFYAAGYRSLSSGGVYGVGSYGYYWLASSYSQDYAYYLYFYSGTVSPHYNNYRALGFSVRPVSRSQN